MKHASEGCLLSCDGHNLLDNICQNFRVPGAFYRTTNMHCARAFSTPPFNAILTFSIHVAISGYRQVLIMRIETHDMAHWHTEKYSYMLTLYVADEGRNVADNKTAT